jgi:hypothetical protein
MEGLLSVEATIRALVDAETVYTQVGQRWWLLFQTGLLEYP